MITIAKIDDKIVEIVRHAHTVGFSDATEWIMICAEPGKANSLRVKWIPASTRIEWVREYISAAHD
jgi:hypothetical protein